MPGIAFGLIVGASVLLLLPPTPWLLVLFAPGAVIITLCTPWWRCGIAMLLGIGIAGAALQSCLADRLDPALAGTDLVVEGTVSGLPERDGRRLRFEFLPRHATANGETIEVPRRVRLSWYGARTPPVRPGEHWRLAVRLRVPRAFANPGAFDYAGWLLRHGIGATGYVRADPAPLRTAPAAFSLDGLRNTLRAHMRPAVAGLRHDDVLLALTLGDRSGLGPGKWRTLVETGTNHLMAISGLHIGLVALVGYGLGGLAWRGSGFLQNRLARPLVKAGIALALATTYAALAGFALPTLRALVMLFIALGALCLRRRVRPLSVLAGAATVVLAADPLAVLDPGFWLSFGAVAAIVLVAAGRLGRPRRVHGWLRLQLAISLALAPILLGLFGQASLVAPLANLIAVPWVSLFTVPAALGGTALVPISPAAGSLVLALADHSLVALWVVLDWLAGLPFAHWRTPAYPFPLLAIAAAGATMLLLPRGVPGKVAGLLALVPLVTWQPPRPPAGGIWLDVLDVGQGLATVVRTAHHTLVYDTGPRFSARFDTGDAVVNPFLRHHGVRELDALVLSHYDNDHAGGVESVRAAFPPAIAWSSTPVRTATGDRFCARGTSWTWDGVRFTFLHPGRDGIWQGNNGSCVLRIDAAGGRVLLPGDIERDAEHHLVDTGTDLAADVVVAPHHGSSTSSTAAFVAAVDPDWVVYAVGHANQWGFPRPGVMARWRPAGWARTDCAGAVHIRIDPDRGVLRPWAWRIVSPRHWSFGCEGSGKSGNMRAFEGPVATSPLAGDPAVSTGP